MRLSFTLAVALTAAAMPALAKPVYNAPADVQAITQIEKSNAVELDPAKVGPVYAPNVVVYDINYPGRYKGRSQIMAAAGPQLAAMKQVAANFNSISILSDGTMACAAMQLSFNVTLRNGYQGKSSMRQLDVFRKVNGIWMIEQEHISYPADPKTGMSMMNLPQAAITPLEFTENPVAGPEVSPVIAKLQIKHWTLKFANASSADDAVNLLGPGDDFLIFDMFAPAPLQGRHATLASYAPEFATIKSFKAVLTDFTADSDGYLGAQIDTQSLTVQTKDGKMFKQTLRQSDCLHYAGGHWYSVFDELSFPVDLKTGKAVMN